ncbi:hypothetical protein OH77DRAFT_1420373 [Trametes cingulata]|nr:hypothetical protein OH77DRAFT_1420373 [Trametes cingulata]
MQLMWPYTGVAACKGGCQELVACGALRCMLWTSRPCWRGSRRPQGAHIQRTMLTQATRDSVMLVAMLSRRTRSWQDYGCTIVGKPTAQLQVNLHSLTDGELPSTPYASQATPLKGSDGWRRDHAWAHLPAPCPYRAGPSSRSPCSILEVKTVMRVPDVVVEASWLPARHMALRLQGSSGLRAEIYVKGAQL